MKRTEKRLIQIAGILGILQGLAWTALSVTCIIIYYSDPLKFPNNYMGFVNLIIYTFFLSSNQEFFEDQSLSGNVFNGFAWVYFVVDLLWVTASICVIKSPGAKILTSWSYVTFAVCFWDLLTVIVLGTDYDKCMDNAGLFDQMVCTNAILPVLVVAAKGFVLWIINAVFAVLLLKIAKALKVQGPRASSRDQVPFSYPNNMVYGYREPSAPQTLQTNQFEQKYPEAVSRHF